MAEHTGFPCCPALLLSRAAAPPEAAAFGLRPPPAQLSISATLGWLDRQASALRIDMLLSGAERPPLASLLSAGEPEGWAIVPVGSNLPDVFGLPSLSCIWGKGWAQRAALPASPTWPPACAASLTFADCCWLRGWSGLPSPNGAYCTGDSQHGRFLAAAVCAGWGVCAA